MTSRTLDKTRPYTHVYGDSPARYYQDRRYFDGQGNEVSAEDAAKPAPGGPTENERAEQRAILSAPTEAELDASVQVVDEPKGNREEQARKRAELRTELSDFKWLQIKAMVRKAGGPEYIGAGAKEKSIDWLVENAV